jgi:hypothetical protein
LIERECISFGVGFENIKILGGKWRAVKIARGIFLISWGLFEWP